MRKVEFLDTSLRDGEQTPGVNFSIKEKIAIAKQLEKWGISAIEAGFPAASPDSFTAVQEIAKVLTKTAVTGLARSVKSDIDACYEALKDAKYPQIHVFIATSPIHRELNSTRPRKKFLKRSKSTFLTLAQNLRLWNSLPKMRPGQNWIPLASCPDCSRCLVLATSIFLIQSVSRHQQSTELFSNT